MVIQKKWFKIMTILMVAFTLILGGCNKKSSKPADTMEPTSSTATATDNEAGAKVDFKGLSFSWYIHYDWATVDPWGSDQTSKWIQEQKGVTINPISSGGAAQQKLNTMIVSAELPEVITLDRAADLNKLAKAGQLVPLDEYIDKYPNLKKWAGEKTLDMLRLEDGKLYSFPNWYGGPDTFGNTGWMVNKKIYQDLGSPSLATFDDLEAYLMQVKEKYPDIIPFETGHEFAGGEVFYSGFSPGRNHTFSRDFQAYPENNELKSIFSDPTYLESLQFVSKLFRAKLITQDGFTQKKEQYEEKLKTGKVAVVANFDILGSAKTGHNALVEKDATSGYQVIEAPHKTGVDASLVKSASVATLGWNVSVITKSAKDPEAIFAYMDWATGAEGQQVLQYGPPGLLWDEVDDQGVPKPNAKFTATTKEELDKLKLGSLNWFANSDWITLSAQHRSLLLPKKPNEFDDTGAVAIMKKSSLPINEFQGITPAPDSEEGIIQVTVKDIYKEAFAKMVFADSNEEVATILEKANKDVTKAGFDKVLTYMTTKWQENLKKLAN
ncbi:MAG: extracellular solute-binding protein [Gorillibacterium sp.]|nr:extracellular solute-binding protein [Gorillibacterium sp.]